MRSSERAHHAGKGRFRNPWPDSQPPAWSKILRLMGEYRAGLRSSPPPPHGSFPVATPEIVYPRRTDGSSTATWIGHSTVLLQLGQINVLTDPMFSTHAFPVQGLGPRRVMDPAVKIDELPPLDVVLLSHSHYDHLDRPSVKRLARAQPQARWVVPCRLGAYIRAWGVREVVELDWWQEEKVGEVKVTATPARHFSARRAGDRNRTLWCGFALEYAGVKVLFTGDTAYHPEFVQVGERCGPFDFVMIPIGAYDPRWFMHVVHVNPEEAVQIYRDLTVAHAGAAHPLMLGIHWGTFRLTSELMDEPPRRTAARWRAVGLDERQLWVARFGETRRVVV